MDFHRLCGVKGLFIAGSVKVNGARKCGWRVRKRECCSRTLKRLCRALCLLAYAKEEFLHFAMNGTAGQVLLAQPDEGNGEVLALLELIP